MSDSVTPAGILAQLGVDLALVQDPGVSSEWPLYIGTLPDETVVTSSTSGNAIGFFSTGGILQPKDMKGGRTIRPGVQVRSRSSTETNAYEILHRIANQFAPITRRNVTLLSSTHEIQNISQQSDVLPLGKSDDQLHEYSVNFIVTINAFYT